MYVSSLNVTSVINFLLDISTWHLSHLKLIKSNPNSRLLHHLNKRHCYHPLILIRNSHTTPSISSYWLHLQNWSQIHSLLPITTLIQTTIISFSTPAASIFGLVSTLASPLPFLCHRVARLLILECTSNHGAPLLKPFWELLSLLRIKFTWPTKTSVMWPIYISLCTSVSFPLFQSYPQTKIFVDYSQPLHTSIPLAWNPLLLTLLLITIHPNTISPWERHTQLLFNRISCHSVSRCPILVLNVIIYCLYLCISLT